MDGGGMQFYYVDCVRNECASHYMLKNFIFPYKSTRMLHI